MITGYGAGGFKINGEFVYGSLIVFADRTMPIDIAGGFISPDHIQPVLARDDIELLIVGTGSQICPIQPAIRSALKAKSIACDVMDTGAACRTYNVLQSEGRRLAALVIAI